METKQLEATQKATTKTPKLDLDLLLLEHQDKILALSGQYHRWQVMKVASSMTLSQRIVSYASQTLTYLDHPDGC
jgi:hypothetical protein